MHDYIIRQAEITDLEKLRLVLKNTNLPFKDIDKHLENFLLLEHFGEIIGSVGLEVYGKVALLRSLAVIKDYQGKKLGQKLYQNIILKSKDLKIIEIYLLTETAANFFKNRGFQKISRNDVPESIQQTAEFSILCPETAVCMLLKIS